MSDKKIKFVDGQMYEYEIYNLVDCYDPILSEKLEPFDFNNPPVVPRYLAVSLIETMVANRGVGLAANQVGLPYRVLVMGAENVGFACFNPEILSVEREETYIPCWSCCARHSQAKGEEKPEENGGCRKLLILLGFFTLAFLWGLMVK